ncbi:ubiquinol oxidase subunit 2 [Acidocella aquatica]|uniref:Ubiquinol oxidase subunit 2 n=1 Tax=Acidocella aquatica TaxID=1922313 RepID=A0ABQ6AAF3_9PROT|nr:COX aromatic rich motif-containing protein [Acidocella aquatica]GLR68732.1 ubiquinol oxidase subunit 2 [Acidocella aquatica]
MNPPKQRRASLLLKPLLALPALLLSGCTMAGIRLFHPAGLVAGAEMHYTLILVITMLIIIVPTLLMTIIFPLRYHHSRNAKYTPDWHFSLTIELLAWGIPFAIVAFLCYLTIQGVYAVNPWAPGILANAPGARQPPINVEVIATDWQWVFVYPDQGIATIDDLVVPSGRVVHLQMTATSNMNGFYIPQVAPMVDAMPAMESRDAFELDQPATYTGFSTDFSGAGFSWMQFSTRVVPQAEFDSWVASVQANPNQLTYAAFQKIAQPTVNAGAKPAYFSAPDKNLFGEVMTAAMQGVVYPVPDSFTKRVSDNSAQGAQAPASPQ